MKVDLPNTSTRDSPAELTSAQTNVWRTVRTVILGTILLLATGMAVERITGSTGLFFDDVHDQISEQQLRDRQQAYAVALPIQLAPVSPEDMSQAVASMSLSQAQEKTLVAQMQAKDEASGFASSSPAANRRGPMPIPVPASEQALRLAWITLWDTDTNDADTVLVTSDGYSRTVVLTNQPVRFAVPIPITGTVKLTGVHDGGGGITVGVTSGSTPVPLPLMSEGQVIGIPVAVP